MDTILILCSTPMGLDESLPNPQRGIFHIQNAGFWQFFDLEYAVLLITLG